MTSGYGMAYYSGRLLGAHRLMMMELGIEIPKGFVVSHKCDYKLCVNPDHLVVSTQAENVQDMIKKGRKVVGKLPSQIGHLNHGSKTDESTVRSAKIMLSKGLRQTDVARATGLTKANVWAIAHGKSWNHVIVVGFDSASPSLISDFVRQ